MLIQCTSCGTQAKISDSKEGAKVKCPSCAHVYVARPRGARGGRSAAAKQDPTKMVIIGIAGLAAAVVAVMVLKGGGKSVEAAPEAPTEDPKPKAPYVDPDSWQGPLVTAVRQLHTAAAAGNESKLLSRLDVQQAYEYELTLPVPEPTPAEVPEGEEPAAAPEPTPRPAWSALEPIDKVNYSNKLIEKAMALGAEGTVAGWKPFDGHVETNEEGEALVLLKCQPIDTTLGLGDRWTQWRLVNPKGSYGSDDSWKWIFVDRWYTEAELAAMARGPRKKVTKKTLSDGSKVYVSEIRTIDFDADIPASERTRLTGLVSALVDDINVRPSVRGEAQEKILQAGKPIIPALLSRMASITETMSKNMDENLDDRIRLNFIHQSLRDITGNETTFQVATEMGGTEERIQAGLEMWFAWYDRKYKRFEAEEEKEYVDPLLDADIPLTDREKREIERERMKRERAKSKR